MLRNMLLMMAFALALNVAPGWAQSFEVTAFGGIRLGGNFNYDSFRNTGSVVSTKVDVANTPNFGVILDVTLNDYTQLELLFDHQSSELTAENPPADLENIPVIDLNIDYYQVGGLYQRPYGDARPFLAVTLGATHLNPKGDFENRWRFSGGLAVGTKFFFSESIGLRLQSRLMGTAINSAEVLCDVFGCFVAGGTYMVQIDFSGGLIIAIE